MNENFSEKTNFTESSPAAPETGVTESSPASGSSSPEIVSSSLADESRHDIGVRLWPAWLILLLGAAATTFFFLWAGDSAPMAAMAIFAGVPSTGLLLILWWLLFSRMPWRSRLLGLGLLVIGTAATMLIAHPKMPWMIGMFGIPGFMALMVIWLSVTVGRNWRIQQTGILIIGLLVIAAAQLFRFDGVYGNMSAQLAWRWAPTDEEIAQAYFQEHGSTGVAREAAEEPLTLSDGDWPGFRGPKRDSVVRGERIRTNWDTNPPKLLWKHPVGLGWSSFAVVGDLIFTQEQRGEHEVVACYNASNGGEVWASKVKTRFTEAAGGDGPRATPTFYEGRLYAQGATGELLCLDAKTGKKYWSTNILEDAGADNIPWGMCGSPLVYDNLVVTSPGGTDGKSLIAHDRLTGKREWSNGSEVATYSSPHLATLQGVRQVLIFNTGGLFGHDPENGDRLWGYKWPSDKTNNTVQPTILDDSTVAVSSVFIGTARITVTKTDGAWDVDGKIHRRMKLYYNDMVAQDGYAYGLDSGVLTCLDLNSGKRMWKDGRYGAGQLLLLEEQNRLFVLGESGDLFLVEATPRGFYEVARYADALDGKTWNHPVIAHGKLFVRNSKEAACFEISPVGE